VAGICAALGPDASLYIKEICESLNHRGPDDEGYYFDKNVAIGHRALKLGSTPAIHQPLANEDKNLWITFDGEIYNKTPIIERLKKDHTFNTDSSAEILVHSYEESGPNCLNQFNGMFAFCLWDSQKRELFCARDRFGMKPFYYFSSNGMFIQASEIKALLAVPSIPRKPNESIIYDYLMTAHDDHITDDTFFTGIRRLPPAHYMLVDGDGVRIRRYWVPARSLRNEGVSKEDGYYASELRQLLRDSIRIRLPRNQPIGTYLSGGIDSTSIACLVNEILTSSDSTLTRPAEYQELFSAIYRERVEQGDEKPYIEEIAQAIKTKPNYVSPSVAGNWKDIQKFVYQVEEPLSAFNYYVFWCLSRRAKEKVNVVFYGHGTGILGGELVTIKDYLRYFRELWEQKKITEMLIEMIGAISLMSAASVKTISSILTGKSDIENLLAQQFTARFSGEEHEKEASFLSEYDYWIRGNLVDILRGSDLISSAFSLEPRYPFLDHRIAEFALSIPSEQKMRKGLSKYVLRTAMKGAVPEAVRMARKHYGTPVPLQRWLKQLYPNIKEIFTSRKFRERGYFNQAAILEAYDRFCEGKMDRFATAWYAFVFWRILNLELWLEAFFDPQNKIANA
jgi:asparagine synthase (glutamine-hydrolysing)